MHGIDPYLSQRSMEHKVHEMQQEAEMDRRHKKGSTAPLEGLGSLGWRLLLASGRAISTLGAWLEGQGEAGEQALDRQIGQSA